MGLLKPSSVMASVRGVAIFLVVIHHANVDISGWLLRDMPFAWGIGIFQYAAVPIFLLCAGLSMSKIAGSRIQLLKAATNYAYIYVLWSLISILLSAFIAKSNVSFSADILASIRSIAFPRSPLWFPYGLAVMLFCAALFTRCDRRLQFGIALAIGFLPMVLHRDIVTNIACNITFFYIGLLFREKIIRVLSFNPWVLLSVCLSGYVGLLLVAAWSGVAYFPPVYTLLGTLAFGALVAFWRALPVPGLYRVSAKLGRTALPILLTHDFWIHVVEKTFGHGPIFNMLSEQAPRWFLPLAATALAMTMSILTYEALKRFRWLFMAPRSLLLHVSNWLMRIYMATRGLTVRKAAP
ncbi:hypothetical protein KBA01_18470 [Kozakia baliensis]|nr:acyltransferase [Kozakia baliensis]GEL64561.1 hypothetical protein KBA01_18470 [Kozakia baliensis]